MTNPKLDKRELDSKRDTLLGLYNNEGVCSRWGGTTVAGDCQISTTCVLSRLISE